MKVVADENIDQDVIVSLQVAGFEVISVAQVARGATDDTVLARSVAEAGVLVTADKDFGDLVFRKKLANHGVVLLRHSGLSNAVRANLVTQAFLRHGSAFLGNFTVIEPGGVRIRRDPGT